jgi:replication-associated recombination protein RarA
VIEDLDYANKKALNGLIPFLDATQNTTLIFTATDMSIIPNAVKSRCIIINLSKYSVDSLLCLAMRIIRNKKLIVNDESFLPRLIEITNYNPRSIVNALEAVWLKGRCIDDTLLRDQDYISNLGLTVGEERDNPL